MRQLYISLKTNRCCRIVKSRCTTVLLLKNQMEEKKKMQPLTNFEKEVLLELIKEYKNVISKTELSEEIHRFTMKHMEELHHSQNKILTKISRAY
ncbi:hypothetical protein C0J52_17281 [Blattella germanica]|nr:hypothetical protein C0J52_17281 [Blattella germanica]